MLPSIKKKIDDVIPGYISKDLWESIGSKSSIVRLNNNLVRYIQQVWKRDFAKPFEHRIYFDCDKIYYFILDSDGLQWSTMDPKEIAGENQVFNQLFKVGSLHGTCAERYSSRCVFDDITLKDMVSLEQIFLQKEYLCAEQAAKTDPRLFAAVSANISKGWIDDNKIPLPEVLGITGRQIKFLKDYTIPENLSDFKKYVNDEEIVSRFPDIQKRIFAVIFLLDYNDRDRRLIMPYYLRASKTLSSLARVKDDDKCYMWHYKDYLSMCHHFDIVRLELRKKEMQDGFDSSLPIENPFPINMKPSKIKEYHDRLSTMNSRIFHELRKRRGSEQQRYSEVINKRWTSEHDDIEYKGKEYSIFMPTDANAIVQEGIKLCHCVGSAGYIRSMAYGKTNILFLRSNKDPEKPMITLEERGGVITQCFGKRDSYNRNPAIRDFIKEYATLRRLTINATIYVGDR